jgi:release factor glutamine methyltransferase
MYDCGVNFLENQKQKLKNEKYAGIETADFFNDAKRLENGEPYEYVVGHVDFCGAYIDLSLRPMIPRPETAFWVTRAIEELKSKYKEEPLRLADTFAGAGNVGLALLVNLRNATVDICELDPKLKEQIEINLEKNNIADGRARVVTSSALDGLIKMIEPAHMDAIRGVSGVCDQAVGNSTARGANERNNNEVRHVCGLYDAIFAVPPYVPYEALPDLDTEMIEHEPHLAFFAHDNGHEFHKILIDSAWDYLHEGGTLYMEADMDHNNAIREMVKGTKWSKLEFWPDPYGATPNVVLRK